MDAVKFQKLSSSLQSVLSGKDSTSILEFNMSGEVPIVGAPIDMDLSKQVLLKVKRCIKGLKDLLIVVI
jgi:hypothetical protein